MTIIFTPSEGLACALEETPDARARPLSPTPGPIGRFPEGERRLLLAEPGIGHGVVERLENAGISSLDQLRQTGIATVVQAICASLQSCAWANRRRALERVMSRVTLL